MNKKKKKPAKSQIDVYLRSNDEVYAKYYPHDDVHLCYELVDYLTSHTIDLNINNTFTINLYCGSGQDPALFQKALLNTFEDKVADARILMRRTIVISITSLLIGFLFGIIAFYSNIENILLTSFLVIVSWVFIWYAVESYSFDHKHILAKMQSYKQLKSAEINSKELPDNEVPSI